LRWYQLFLSLQKCTLLLSDRQDIVFALSSIRFAERPIVRIFITMQQRAAFLGVLRESEGVGAVPLPDWTVF